MNVGSNRLEQLARKLLGLAILGLANGCDEKSNGSYQGYIEGEFVYVASPLAGTLSHLAVARGDAAKKGGLLFELESESEAADVREADQRLSQAQALLENLKKGKRPTEIAALEGQLARAQSDLKLAESDLKRQVELGQDSIASMDQLDRARAARDGAQALVDSLSADLSTARLGARADEVTAAKADVEARSAALAKARWSLEQKRQSSPATAHVDDTLYRSGEWVGAGKPVVVLLPPENIKVRFFVPQSSLPTIQSGQVVTVLCDGLPRPVRATVNFISSQAEFTPPVIYSRENRAKLVFMIEATFAASDAEGLRPGQPADVKLVGTAP